MSDPRITAAHVGPSSDGARLAIRWEDGHVSEYAPLALRAACRCAGCVDEMTGAPVLDPSRIPADVHPLEISYVGRYALGFRWSDGHSTGIYPFPLLRGLCPCEECRG